MANWTNQIDEYLAGCHMTRRLSSHTIAAYKNDLRQFSALMSHNEIASPTLVRDWPAPGFEDTKLGVFMEPEVCHGTTEVYARVQA